MIKTGTFATPDNVSPSTLIMLERLNAASTTLETALDEYLEACRVIRETYVDDQAINTIDHDLALGLAKQVPVIESLRQKLELAKKLAGRSMNASSSLVPIHKLPSEILVRIFKLALSNNCHYHESQKIHVLTSICAYWRQVACSSPALWTHIDLLVRIAPSLPPQFNHAKAYAKRAMPLPLEIHITDEYLPTGDISTTLASFVASIAPRVASLTINSRHPHHFQPTLSELFNNCSPGVLKALTTDILMGDTIFLNPEDANQRRLDRRKWLGITSKERFNEVFLGITTLQLGSMYPSWASNAYHGLTELRLTRRGGCPNIAEFQLVMALRNSPGLRIFECAIQLTEEPWKLDGPINPVPLGDLEVVNLGENEPADVEMIVRWLAPGPKPLQLLVSDADFSAPCFTAFLSRSNITKVYTKEYGLEDMRVMRFVERLPNLQVMALGRMIRIYDRGWAPKQPQYKVISSKLETLHVNYHCFTKSKTLREVVSLESLRRVIFYSWEGPNQPLLSELLQLNRRVEFEFLPWGMPSSVGEWDAITPGSF
ncbi:hypothetical protein OPQ81_003886 [Rhizoctonia solani]|nr:hypothetical protein OPQ81_003886 [Rhizoctonia solani]